MPIKDLINSLRSMELPNSAESLLSSIGTEAQTLEADRDDLRGKVQTRQKENEKLTTRAQNAESERDDLKAKQPADGARVLSKDEASEYDAYKALGKPAGELKTELDAATITRAELVKTKNLSVAAKLGLKPAALRLREFDGVELSAEGEGETLKATVKTAEGEKTWDEWVKAVKLEDDLKDFTFEDAPAPIFGQPGRREQPKDKNTIRSESDRAFS